MNSIAPDQRQKFTDADGRLTVYGVKLLRSYFERGGSYVAPTNADLESMSGDLTSQIALATAAISALTAQVAVLTAEVQTLEALAASLRTSTAPDTKALEILQATRWH